MPSMKSRAKARPAPEIPLAPLIDLMFTLLIFLLVTTSFTQSRAMEVDRPEATTGRAAPKETVTLTLRRDERLYLGRTEIPLASVRPRLQEERRRRPGVSVVVSADKAGSTGSLVRLMDECRKAGIRDIYVATERR